MTCKTKITNMASVALIYRANNPSKILLEVKDCGHPLKLVHNQLCPIGGNWIGPAATNDRNPLATCRREIMEELTHLRSIRDANDLVELGMADAQRFAPTPPSKVSITSYDIAQLNLLKHVICSGLVPFGSFLNNIPKSALDATDPKNQKPGFMSLVSYFTVGLDEAEWTILEILQDKTGNLSNESVTRITTLDEIVRTGTLTAFAHDRVLRGFFLSHGFDQARNLPLVPGLESIPVGMPLSTYSEYMEHYQIEKKPV